MPVTQRKCPTDKCPYHWIPGPWSTVGTDVHLSFRSRFQCSKTCGKGGYQFRRIECKVKREMRGNATAPPGSEPTVLSRMCMSLEKPAVSKECVMNECSAEYHWSVGPWAQV